MPRSPKYPLEPLRRHRDHLVDEATAELGDAVEAREAADAERRRAEAARRAAEEEAARTREAERARLERGELRAGDLAQAEAWGVAVARQASELAGEVARAEARLEGARAEEAAARAALAQKKADAQVVEKDQARFAARLRREAEAHEEEAADEIWAARRKP